MNLRTGLSALQANQFAINNISHNLANASTEGYHRQDTIFQTRRSDYRLRGHYVGAGVEVSELRRIRSLITESALTNSIADLSRVEQTLVIESRIEALVAPGAGSIQDSLSGLFDNLSRLSANPDESSLRNSIVNESSNIAVRVHDTANQMVGIQNDLRQQLELEVESLNREIRELVDIHDLITTDADGRIPNDLLDQRDQLVNQIAERVDVQRYEFVQNELGLSIAGGSVSISSPPIQFELTGSGDALEIQIEGGDRSIEFAGGRIAALLDANNRIINRYKNDIDEFASQLIRHFDQQHAQGLGLEGPFASLQASRPVTDVDAPLSESAAFPIEAGQWFVTVTAPDGQLRTTSIDVDPDTDSLRDIASRLSGINNLQAVVDDATGLMTMIAEPGYAFDFTGRLESTPDLSSVTGTSTPTIGGTYLGDDNDVYTVTAMGSGQIGVTPGLTLEISDSDGNVVQEIEVGDGYEAGSQIDIGDGITLAFDVGDIVNGDQFEVVRVANSDSTGILSSLGLNHFFNGSNAGDIKVDNKFANNPNLIATSLSGELADTRNLAEFIELRDQAVFEGQLTFESFLSEMNTEIGFQVQTSQRIEATLSELKFQYETEREAVSGVDVNEELIELTQHQKNYEAAIQVVRTMESMLDELFQIIR